MGERKVLNKYYPPDFDPSKIPKRKQPKNKQTTVRTMLPMSIRCNTCGNYMSKGTKFNSRQEDAVGEDYLGIQIVRFYIKCTNCSAEITIKTDPRNSDYTVEAGASRNFEPWRNQDEELAEKKRKRDAEEMGDGMKALENKALDSKREMDRLADVGELMSVKSRHATVSFDDVLQAIQRGGEDEERKLDEADEELIKSVFHGRKVFVKRIDDDDDDDDDFSTDKTAGDNVSAATDVLATGNFSVDTKKSDSSRITFNVKKKQMDMKKGKIKGGVCKNKVNRLLAKYDSQDAGC
ncbi:uncharacterized protein LOC141607074 [Silene latifolia]|uniref:uncharacterized protein LOC141607074 n=1 Tax=Silene latifolia TaxID=37657 RepID=UPI003D76D2A4